MRKFGIDDECECSSDGGSDGDESDGSIGSLAGWLVPDDYQSDGGESCGGASASSDPAPRVCRSDSESGSPPGSPVVRAASASVVRRVGRIVACGDDDDDGRGETPVLGGSFPLSLDNFDCDLDPFGDELGECLFGAMESPALVPRASSVPVPAASALGGDGGRASSSFLVGPLHSSAEAGSPVLVPRVLVPGSGGSSGPNAAVGDSGAPGARRATRDPPEGTARFRHWCATANNYDAVTIELFRRACTPDASTGDAYCNYLVMQPEVCPTTGTKHLQVFLSCPFPRTLVSLRKRFGGSIHFERTKASADANRRYCTKTESRDVSAGWGPEEFGVFPAGAGKKGSRSDISDFTDKIKLGGRDLKALFEEFPVPFLRYERAARVCMGLYQPVRSTKTHVRWFYGPTGSGKSRLAQQTHPGAYWKSADTKWWDGFDGVQPVILDDYRYSFCSFAHLLRLLDRYPLSVEYKGGSVHFNPQSMIITCCRHPRHEWMYHSTEDIGQLLRRIEEITYFGTVEFPTEADYFGYQQQQVDQRLSLSVPAAPVGPLVGFVTSSRAPNGR